MGELRGRGPAGKLSVLVQIFSADEFDDGLLRFRARPLRKKYSTVARAAQQLSQREFVICDAAFPVFPAFARSAHRPRLGEALFYSTSGLGAPEIARQRGAGGKARAAARRTISPGEYVKLKERRARSSVGRAMPF